ncbi:MAG: NUDIX hydrolase [Bacteroidota bacterium]
MHRLPLLAQLDSYAPIDTEEIAFKKDMISFIAKNEHCFERTLTSGHITGSAWVVNYSFSKALLTHHSKLDRWLQLGGHADGNTDIIAVASKEAQEESGLKSLELMSELIFDIDIHSIPARKSEPTHLHYDVRFLFQADENEMLHVSSESKSLKWIPFEQLSFYTQHNKSILRMSSKCLKR